MNDSQKVAQYDVARPSNPDEMPAVKLDEAHSPTKVLAHEELVRKFVDGEDFNPVHMRLGIMGACNMRCNFCNFHSPNEEQFYDLFSFKDAIPTKAAVRLMEQFAEADGKAVTFCGSGECTIHPGFTEISYAAKTAGLKLGLITNGSRLGKDKLASCIAETHTWVRIGLNAGTEATFNQITRDRDETFASFVQTPARMRANAIDPDFKIGFNFVITAENYKEIVAAATIARDSGAHYVRFEPEFYSAMGHETIEEVMSEVTTALEEVSSFSSDRFEVSVPKLDRGPMDQVEEVEGDFDRCHYSRFVTAVGADGNLYPCPQVHLNSRYLIGNVIKEGYQNVLDGGPREQWEQENPRRTDLCKSCFYRPQNELLEWLKRGNVNLDEALQSYRIEVPQTLHAEFC